MCEINSPLFNLTSMWKEIQAVCTSNNKPSFKKARNFFTPVCPKQSSYGILHSLKNAAYRD